MNISKSTYYAAAGLFLIVIIGLGLHLFRINYPAQPVFDEAHFATYAGDYASGHPFYDIHPPLGKAIYALPLLFYPPHVLQNAQFVTITRNPDGGLVATGTSIPYGDFPYVALRLVSALFGILLPVVFYFFMRNIGTGRVAASLGAAFILFDNAFLVNTRLIFMDGMFILFGLAALALYFHRPHFSFAAGALWGLSLAVKLTGVVFLGPLIAVFLLAPGAEKKEEKRQLIKFAAAGFAVLILISLAGTFRFSVSERLNVLASFGLIDTGAAQLTPEWQGAHPVLAHLTADLGEAMFSVASYTVGRGHDGSSPWYFWPVMEVPISYYAFDAGSGGGRITFAGNPITWFASTIAVIAALVLAFRHAWERRLGKDSNRPLLILLTGYIACMAPFLFVQRSTFLYHYLPALAFAFGILAWFTARILKLDDWSDLTSWRAPVLLIILILVAAGFWGMAPLTYGL